MKLPKMPDNPTELQRAFHDYIRGKITYGKYKEVLARTMPK